MKSRLITMLAIAALLVGALPVLVAAGDQRSAAMQTLPGLDVIDGNGKANFGGSIVVPNAVDAEFHIVIADHGVKDPAQLPGQIKTPSMNVVQTGFILP